MYYRSVDGDFEAIILRQLVLRSAIETRNYRMINLPEQTTQKTYFWSREIVSFIPKTSMMIAHISMFTLYEPFRKESTFHWMPWNTSSLDIH